MGKKVYFGVGGGSRKVRKGYIGVGGWPRKVRKGYIGVGGIARPFWTGGELEYYGNSQDGAVSAMPKELSGVRSANTENAVFFAYGSDNNSNRYYQHSSNVYKIDESLTWVNAGNDNDEVYNISIAHTKSRAFFAGGEYEPRYSGSNSWYSINTLKIRDSNLTTTNLALSAATQNLCGCNGDNSVLFAGGASMSGGYTAFLKTVAAYTNSGTKHQLSDLDKYHYQIDYGADTKNYFLPLHGSYDSIEVYSKLDYTKMPNVTIPNKYINLWPNGRLGKDACVSLRTPDNLVYAFALISDDLSIQVCENSSANIRCVNVEMEEELVFAGSISSSYSDTVFTLDEYFTQRYITSLGQARNGFAGGTVGRYVVFAGGYIGGYGATDYVDIYTM